MVRSTPYPTLVLRIAGGRTMYRGRNVGELAMRARELAGRGYRCWIRRADHRADQAVELHPKPWRLEPYVAETWGFDLCKTLAAMDEHLNPGGTP